MIIFGCNGLQTSHWKTCPKRCDGVHAPKWNLEVEPFVAQWIIQVEEDTHGLGAIENHMPFWDVVRKEMCCWLVLKLQKGNDVD